MQVPYGEGVANRTGPEPCADVRKGVGEASAGERTGQPLNRERPIIPGADTVSECGRLYARARRSRAPGRPGVVKDPGMCRSFLCGNREVPRPAGSAGNARCSGPHREGEEPKPMMHDRGKSDSAIVAAKPTNNAGQPAAEPVEPRAGTKRNAGEQSTHRTQGRTRVTQALARVRKAAQQRKKEKFTALFHHLSVDLLREAFLVLKRDAAPGMDGLTWQVYAADLERNLTDLHARIHRGAYRATPSRRTYIPKADGRQRPLAVAALEDKIVQRATVAVLNCIYEEEFLGSATAFGQSAASTMRWTPWWSGSPPRR